MKTEDELRIGAYFDRLVDQHGYGFRACDAHSLTTLEVRWQALADAMDYTGKSVLEVGCGFGDLGAFILSRYRDVDYLGIDISPRMVDEGRKEHPELDLRAESVYDLDPAETFDVVLAQGIFYLLGSDAEEKMHALMTKLFGLANDVFALCTSSAWSANQDPNEFYADPVEVLSFAHQLTPAVVLRHDYHPGDFAMYLYKNTRGPY
jgi:SAM-dependent methyltransferase